MRALTLVLPILLLTPIASALELSVINAETFKNAGSFYIKGNFCINNQCRYRQVRVDTRAIVFRGNNDTPIPIKEVIELKGSKFIVNVYDSSILKVMEIGE